MKTRHRFGVIAVALLLSWPASGFALHDVLISEYVEGSSNNKAIELFNPTGSAIDLSAGSYQLEFYFNGSGSAGSTIPLTGTIPAGGTYVLADNDAAAPILGVADQTSTASFYNGDDAIVLRKAAAVIDAIGQVGFDPGSEWGTGLQSTQNNTLRRKGTVCDGDTDETNVFDPAVEWDGFAQDTFDGLGSHTHSCATVPVTASTWAEIKARYYSR